MYDENVLRKGMKFSRMIYNNMYNNSKKWSRNKKCRTSSVDTPYVHNFNIHPIYNHLFQSWNSSIHREH